MNFKSDRSWIRTSAMASLAAVLVLFPLSSAHADPSGRTGKQIEAEILHDAAEADQKGGFDDTVEYNPIYHQQMLGEVGPRYQREGDLYRELATAAPKLAVSANHMASVDDARLAFWGDPAAKSRIETLAASSDKASAAEGHFDKQLIAWWKAFGKKDDQAAVVATMDKSASENPTSAALADDLSLMLQTNPATVQLGQRVTSILLVKLARTEISKSYAAKPNKIDEPLDFEGTTIKGKSFRLKDLRGKVVLVDFWATWCHPCMEEMPHVAELYQQYHDQGFEIIGVSSDNDRAELASFLQQHTEMPWQQLFSAGNGWHPLTRKFGINSIPRMLLVDRNGNLRRMTQEAAPLKDLMPVLLAETYVPPPPPVKAPRPPVKPITQRPIGE
jgi:thiol-disulfide isomerase/thioredoxin